MNELNGFTVRGLSVSSTLMATSSTYGKVPNLYWVVNSIGTKKYVFGKATTFNFEPIAEGTTLDTIVQGALSGYAISPFTFKGGHRGKPNIDAAANILMLDIDIDSVDTNGNLILPTAEIALNVASQLKAILDNLNIAYITMPTQNHMATGYKYRVLIPIDTTEALNWSLFEYEACGRDIVDKLDNIRGLDKSCIEPARFFAPTLLPIGSNVTVPAHDGFGGASDTEVVYTAVSYEELQYRCNQLGLALTGDGQVVLGTEAYAMYPRNLNAPLYKFTKEVATKVTTTLMAQNQDRSLSGSTISGLTKIQLLEDVRHQEKTVKGGIKDRLNFDEPIYIGDLSQGLPKDTRVDCVCPTSHLHSDNNDRAGYAWVLKEGNGRLVLHCASAHCQEAYGKYRQVVFPDYRNFIGEGTDIEIDSPSLFNETVDAINTLYAHFLDTLILKYGIGAALNKEYNLEIDTTQGKAEVSKLLSTCKKKLEEDFIHEDGLKLLLLNTMINSSTNSPSPSGSYVNRLTLAGTFWTISRMFDTSGGTVAGAHFVEYWLSHILDMPKWNAMLERHSDILALSDKDKGGRLRIHGLRYIIFDAVINGGLSTIKRISDINDMEVTSANIGTASRVLISLKSGYRHTTLVSNTYTKALKVHYNTMRRKKLPENMIAKFEALYDEHWKLPLENIDIQLPELGGIVLPSLQVTNTIDLIILTALLNRLSNATDTDQRGTAFAISAPSGMGKSTILAQLSALSLTNKPNSFVVSDFAPNKLSSVQKELVQDKLFLTGDEVQASTFKHTIDEDAFRANLTSKNIKLNIKYSVDTYIEANAKVLMGTQILEALDSLSTSTEMYKRINVIEYPENCPKPLIHAGSTMSYDFRDVMGKYRVSIDDVMQFILARRYFKFAAYVTEVARKGFDSDERTSAYAIFKHLVDNELMEKYNGGRLRYKTDEGTVQAVERASDEKQKFIAFLNVYRQWYNIMVAPGVTNTAINYRANLLEHTSKEPSIMHNIITAKHMTQDKGRVALSTITAPDIITELQNVIANPAQSLTLEGLKDAQAKNPTLPAQQFKYAVTTEALSILAYEQGLPYIVIPIFSTSKSPVYTKHMHGVTLGVASAFFAMPDTALPSVKAFKNLTSLTSGIDGVRIVDRKELGTILHRDITIEVAVKKRLNKFIVIDRVKFDKLIEEGI